MSEHAPFIVVEILLVFGGAMAFAWWQFRDLDREKRKRQQREAERADGKPPAHDRANGHAS